MKTPTAAPTPTLPPGEAEPVLPVLYRDEHLLIVNKPSGLAVHRGECRDRITALSLARDQVGSWVYPVHRLDRATSGALVFALDRRAARRLQEALVSSLAGKRYIALVRGIPPEQGVIDHPVPGSSTRGAPRVPATTSYRRLGIFERYALMEARPHTGRRHQIRRHFKHASHPLIGDVRYGKGDHNRLFRERFGLHRLALHALEIRLLHPWQEQPLTVVAPLPADLAGPLALMGLWPLPEEPEYGSRGRRD